MDAINKFHCQTVKGNATVWQGKFYSELNVSSTHALSKFVLCIQDSPLATLWNESRPPPFFV